MCNKPVEANLTIGTFATESHEIYGESQGRSLVLKVDCKCDIGISNSLFDQEGHQNSYFSYFDLRKYVKNYVPF